VQSIEQLVGPQMFESNVHIWPPEHEQVEPLHFGGVPLSPQAQRQSTAASAKGIFILRSVLQALVLQEGQRNQRIATMTVRKNRTPARVSVTTLTVAKRRTRN
jgi:hypothetical protein